MNKAQIAIEYLVITMTAVIFLIILVTSLSKMSSDRMDEDAILQLQDLGNSIQEEMLVASEMTNGYTRVFFVPKQLKKRSFTITTGNTSEYNGYLTLGIDQAEYYFRIPVINGNITTGYNTIRKINNTLIVTQ